MQVSARISHICKTTKTISIQFSGVRAFRNDKKNLSIQKVNETEKNHHVNL